MQRRATLLIATTALVAGLTACDATEPYAAKVNGETIPMKSFQDELAVVAENAQAQDPSQVLTDGSSVTGDVARFHLTNQIYLSVLTAEAERLELDLEALDEEQRQEVQALVQSLGGVEADQLPAGIRAKFERQAQALVALRAELTAVDPDVLAAAVDAAVAGVKCVSHILVETQADADAVVERLADGEQFSALAEELSTDPGSGSVGGALDSPDSCTADAELDRYIPEFAAAARAATFGEPTAPVQSEFGFHIILVSAPPAETLASRRAQFEQELVGQLGGTGFNDFLEKAFAEAEVTVSAKIGRWDAVEGVVPITPPAPDTQQTDQIEVEDS